MTPIERHAVISPCGTYRYMLMRDWQHPLLLPSPTCSLAFIMLNPSTADANLDDPTIRRCMAFARREGFYGIRVFNLFALRSTDPKALRFAADPVGPENDSHLSRCRMYGDVIAAWGSVPFAADRIRRVLSILRGSAVKCLGTNKDGSPKHPLYIPKNAPLIPWSGQ